MAKDFPIVHMMSLQRCIAKILKTSQNRKRFRNRMNHIPLQKLPITVGKMAGAVDLVLNDIPDLLDELVEYVNTTDDHPLIIAAVVHYQLVTIHPFEDGKGITCIVLFRKRKSSSSGNLDQLFFENDELDGSL